ncbi:hypothetical protein B0O99DRAFT_490262, partial [Bisporella sp. PMI_857]
VYFWREYGDNRDFLSQWYTSPFTAAEEGITYVTAEQYMMYQKAILFNDQERAAAILETTSPKTQKALGRKVTPFVNDTWNKNRERIVQDGSYYKFKNGKDSEGRPLKERLLATGNRELVEASPMDRIWGVGFGEKNAEKNRKSWGLNLLGKALMHARDRLREGDQGAETRRGEDE